MRSHTTLRTAFFMIAAATGVTLAAADARADVASDPSAPNTSIGTAALKYEHNKGLDTTIDTGMKNLVGGPSSKISLAVGAGITIDPVKNGGPLFKVDMPKGAIVEASWSNDKKIVLKARNGSATDGTITVRHTLSPTLKLGLSAFGINVNLNYSATDLIQMLQNKIGANAQFNYDSRASQAFAPWGFAKVDTKLNSPDLSGAELFTYPMADISLLADNNFDGEFGIRATTKPTFSYTTKKVSLSGADGSIGAQGGEVSMIAVDGDFLETMVNAEGEMAVTGNIDIQPFVSLTKAPVLGNITVDFPITAYSAPYTATPVKCSFQSVVVHIPLPNVHAPKAGVDLGMVKAGGSATKTVTIENSGEKAASMTFKSSDPSFKVPGGTINIEPKGKYDLQLQFASANAGPASADITVLSNDPDSPEQTFKVGANGADVGGTGEESTDVPGSGGGDSSGCGCKTAGGTSNLPSWAGFGLLGLGLVAASRRRKNG